MKVDKNIITEIERLLEKYEIEIEKKQKAGILLHNTAKTYLLHSTNFVRWCKDEFVPGGRKLKVD